MKRLKSNAGVPRPRQDTVSCHLCRTKKLKCDRQQPCFNCSSRGIACDQPVKSSKRSSESKQQSTVIENTEILGRLKALEDEVSALRSMSFRPMQPVQQASPVTTLPRSSTDDEHRAAFEWLEGIGAGNESIVPEHLMGIALNVKPIHPLQETSDVYDDSALSPDNVWLPAKTEAIQLFQYYRENVNYLHPVIYPQSVEGIIYAVYNHSGVQTYTQPAHIALLLSIFASTSHLWSPRENEDLIFKSPKAAHQASSIWRKSALDVLEYSRRTTSGSIEDVQATIIMCYLIHNIQGFTALFRSLNGISLTMARDLYLHKLDSPQIIGKRTGPGLSASFVDKEVKRRIWWHIVSLDWLLALTGGPHQGMYCIQPAHMCVNYPDIECSEDLTVQNCGSNNLDSASMAYFHGRVQLSEICRTIVDWMPNFPAGIESVSYEHIITLDRKFEDLLANLPDFFRLNKSGIKRQDTGRNAPKIAIQRYLIHLGANTRRSKLHQPFLIRGFVDSQYAYSRDACLHSARSVLEVSRILGEEKSNLTCIPARLGTVVHHVFLATVILVMDLCFNKIERCEEERQAEVMRACRMLEDSKHESILARKLLQPLMDILQKHKIRLLNQQSTASPIAGNPFTSMSTGNECTNNNNPVPSAVSSSQQQGTMQTLNDVGIDEMMRNYINLGPMIDVPSWDSLFTDLDSFHALDTGGNDLFNI